MKKFITVSFFLFAASIALAGPISVEIGGTPILPAIKVNTTTTSLGQVWNQDGGYRFPDGTVQTTAVVAVAGGDAGFATFGAYTLISSTGIVAQTKMPRAAACYEVTFVTAAAGVDVAGDLVINVKIAGGATLGTLNVPCATTVAQVTSGACSGAWAAADSVEIDLDRTSCTSTGPGGNILVSYTQ
jgi:hypothetical protein